MKRQLLIGILVVLNMAFGYGQKFFTGPKVGIGLSKHYQNKNSVLKSSDYESILTYNLAYAVYFNLGDNFTIGVEPGYILKGSSISDGMQKFKLHYANLPLVSNFKLTKKFGVTFGPEFSYLIRAYWHYHNAIDHGNDVDDQTKGYDKFEMSGLAGISYQFNTYLLFGLRYSRSFTKHTELAELNNSGIIMGQVKVYNEFVQLFLTMNIKNITNNKSNDSSRNQ